MLYALLRPILFLFDPESIHRLTLKLLKSLPNWWVQRQQRKFPKHRVQVLGLNFPNPVGLAAGFDSNGDALNQLPGLGFGFIELGGVTPKPQPGNAKPRLFRLRKKKALINHMGFCNKGVKYLAHQLRQRHSKIIIGVNIAKQRDTPLENAIDDYNYCLAKIYPYVSYIAVNVSSPNTPGLRELQSAIYFNDLLFRLKLTQQHLAQQWQRYVPLLIKISPDVDDQQLQEMITAIVKHDIDGVIATNTSLNLKPQLAALKHGKEQGGVSGAPLNSRSTEVIKRIATLTRGQLPIIAVGGICSASDAQEKLSAGASLVQVYTGLVYQGPKLIKAILNALVH